MRQRGYTLLEILVVVAVIAVLSGALLLSARGAGSDRQIEDEARRLHRVLQLLCDEAVVEGRFAGFGYSAKSYSGFELTPQGWQTVKRDGPMQPHDLANGLKLVEALVEDPLPPTLPEKPQLLCAPTGDIGEHDLILSAAGAQTGWKIALDRNGVSVLSAWGAQ